ncbi:hypothetical protein T06_15877 [Trichinella sp. T6]|nr:hypothetical protein T06_15877 [Trichinella sp. T6]
MCSLANEKILIWHGILEVPEETDCTGITSVKRKISFLSLSQSQDREEEIYKKRTGRKPLKEKPLKKTTRSPVKEKILTGPSLRLEKEEVVEKRSTGCKERTGGGYKL